MFPSDSSTAIPVGTVSNDDLQSANFSVSRVFKSPGVMNYRRYCRSGIMRGHTKQFMKNTGSYDQATNGTLSPPAIPWFWHVYVYPFKLSASEEPYTTKYVADVKITYYCLFYGRDEIL